MITKSLNGLQSSASPFALQHISCFHQNPHPLRLLKYLITGHSQMTTQAQTLDETRRTLLASNAEMRQQMTALDAANREFRADIGHLKSIVRQQHTRITYLELSLQLCEDEIQHLHSEIHCQAKLRVLELHQVRREHGMNEIRAQREHLKRKAAELGVHETLRR
jgi:hypothetical protein